MLEIRPNCEHCNKDLPNTSTEAMICTFECTYCRTCALEIFENVCPNCTGNFVERPIRPSKYDEKYPASTERVFKPKDLKLIKQHRCKKVEIIEFTNELKEPIKSLNYEWLEKYFKIEKGDVISLSNPKENIIDKGGFIYYAKFNNEIVGTVSLLKRTDTVFELGKMAVTEKTQGYRIGTILLEHSLKIAKQKKIKKLILYSNTILKSAIHLYKKYGFIETKLESGLYERANIKMEKQL